jgi:hypothetical protein
MRTEWGILPRHAEIILLVAKYKSMFLIVADLKERGKGTRMIVSMGQKGLLDRVGL